MSNSLWHNRVLPTDSSVHGLSQARILELYIYITLSTNIHIVKVMVFPVVMYGCESSIKKKAEHWKTDASGLWCWRRLLDCKEIKPVNPKGNQPWLFIGRNVAEAEAPIRWPLDVKSAHWKRPWCRKDWRQKKKRVTVDEMIR